MDKLWLPEPSCWYHLSEFVALKIMLLASILNVKTCWIYLLLFFLQQVCPSQSYLVGICIEILEHQKG